MQNNVTHGRLHESFELGLAGQQVRITDWLSKFGIATLPRITRLQSGDYISARGARSYLQPRLRLPGRGVLEYSRLPGIAC